MRKNINCIVLSLLWLLPMQFALAEQFAPQSIEQQIATSQVVLTAKVTAIKNHYKDGKIEQHVNLAIDEALKGSVEQQAVIVLEGGEAEVNGIRFATVNPNAPGLALNQYYLFYLNADQQEANTYLLAKGTKSAIPMGRSMHSSVLTSQSREHLTAVKALLKKQQ